MDGAVERNLGDEDATPTAAFWVFAYGSLMWNPGFPHIDRRHAELTGYARRFCLWSIHYRGTPEAPGLVLGLAADPDAAVQGVAYAVAEADADEVRAYLHERELVTDAYRELEERVDLLCRPTSSLRSASALAYVCDAAHEQFAGDLSLEAQAEIIADRIGPRGPNWVYLYNTVAHLREIGVHDATLERLDALVRHRRAEMTA